MTKRRKRKPGGKLPAYRSGGRADRKPRQAGGEVDPMGRSAKREVDPLTGRWHGGRSWWGVMLTSTIAAD